VTVSENFPMLCLHKTVIDEQPVRPAIELGWFFEAADVPPDVEEGLLRRVLGQMTVAEDAVGHPVQTGVVGNRQRLERLLVALLRLDHEVLVHTLSLVRTEPISASTGYEWI
jgi:hypothetical protein